MGTLSRAAVLLLTTIVAPLIPERYRSCWPWADLLHTPGVQSLHGYLWAVAGVVFWAWGLVVYEAQMSDLVVAVITDERGSGDVGPITHYGMVLYFSYLVSLRGFLLTVLLLDGIVRGCAGAMTGSVPGSVYLALPLAVGRWLKALWRRSRLSARYGPPGEPDEFIEEGERLRVRRTRPHPEWNADQAFRYGDRLFRLHNVDDEAAVRGRLRFEYTFTPWPEGRTLRRVVTLAPPSAGPPDDTPPGS